MKYYFDIYNRNMSDILEEINKIKEELEEMKNIMVISKDIIKKLIDDCDIKKLFEYNKKGLLKNYFDSNIFVNLITNPKYDSFNNSDKFIIFHLLFDILSDKHKKEIFNNLIANKNVKNTLDSESNFYIKYWYF